MKQDESKVETKQEQRRDSDQKPQYEPKDEPKPEQKPKHRSDEREMEMPKEGNRSGTLSKSCILSGCLVIIVIFFILGGILAYTMLKDDEIDNEQEGFEYIIDVDQKPRTDVEYIHENRMLKVGFAQGVPSDGAKPILVMYFTVGDSRDRTMLEVRSLGNCRYKIFNKDSDALDGELFVYPGADSIRITSKGEDVILKTAESFHEAVSSIDPSYTPARYAIKARSDKGKWETLQSGEIVYVYPSGTYARSVWIKDGNKYYYVDVSGCRMKNNYAHDGFYAGADGSWDKSVKCIDRNVLPINGKKYLDISAQKWTFQMKTDRDGTIKGTARHTYGDGIGLVEDYDVKSFGSSAYSLFNKKNEFVSYHMVVLDKGRTIRVSGAGATEVFHAPN